MRWPGFDLSLFVNNALDSRPSRNLAGWANLYDDRQLAYTVRPRTVGLSVTWRF